MRSAGESSKRDPFASGNGRYGNSGLHRQECPARIPDSGLPHGFPGMSGTDPQVEGLAALAEDLTARW